jgi:hypothetical protein
MTVGIARIDDKDINHPRPSDQAGNITSLYLVGLKSIQVKIKMACKIE